jgi:5S rRNA maturation endonuclease (ribonuclease M5)
MKSLSVLSDAQRIITSEVRKIRGRRQPTIGGIMVQCPFHPGDNDPSAKINLDPNTLYKGSRVPVGFLHCFGCGANRPWNDVAERLGLATVDENDTVVTTAVGREMGHLYQTYKSFDDIMEYWHIADWDKPTASWRGFSSRFLRRLGAVYGVDERNSEPFVVFPVTVGNDLVGAIKARCRKAEGKLSYINSPGGWSREQGLFPYDYVRRKNPRTIWLVEGPRDALRLIALGIPALCILGTQSFSEAKRDLVLALAPERVVFCFDGDRAGAQALELIKPLFESLIETRTVDLRRVAKRMGVKKMDPFELPLKYVNHFKKRHHLE